MWTFFVVEEIIRRLTTASLNSISYHIRSILFHISTSVLKLRKYKKKIKQAYKETFYVITNRNRSKFKLINTQVEHVHATILNCNSVFSEQNLHNLTLIQESTFSQMDIVNKHIHTIHGKAAKILNLLCMLKYKINRKSFVIKYNAKIRQNLEY